MMNLKVTKEQTIQETLDDGFEYYYDEEVASERNS